MMPSSSSSSPSSSATNGRSHDAAASKSSSFSDRLTTSPSTSSRKAPNRFFAWYLLLYNVGMTAGWFVILVRLINALLLHSSSPSSTTSTSSSFPSFPSPSSIAAVYDAVQLPLKLFQTGAVLEIVHAATRLVRSHPMVTALQVGSRLMLVWGVVEPVALVRSNLSFVTMVLAWSLTEIPRYFYFSVAALVASSKDVPFWVMSTRYSTFLPLYPLGAGSEWLTLYAALPHIYESDILSIAMPNRFNIAFDYGTLCFIILILYIPGLPYMYMHMMGQRRKYMAMYSAPTSQQLNQQASNKLGKVQ